MKASAYIALTLPFVLLLMLLASVIVTPRLDARHQAHAAAVPARIVTLPAIQVRPDATPLVLQADTTPAETVNMRARSALQLRMPYFSFADEFSLTSGH